MSVCPCVRMYVRTSVCPQKVSSISMKFGLYVEVDERCMTVYSNAPIHGQGNEPFNPFKVGNLAIFNSYLRHLQWELANDHRF